MNLSTASTASASAAPSFTLEDFQRAAQIAQQIMDDGARFFERTLLKHGIDITTHSLFVGSAFDRSTIPAKYALKVVTSKLLKPEEIIVFAGDLRDWHYPSFSMTRLEVAP